MIFALFLAATLGLGERSVSDPHLVPLNVTPYIASNGRNSVAVWTMRRGTEIYSIRELFDRDGNVIDDATIWKGAIGVTGIATDGERYLVTFDQAMPLLLDANGAPIRFIPTSKATAVASDGSGFVLWNQYSLSVQLLDREGAAIGERISVPDWIVTIASAGSGYIVVTSRSIYMLQRGVLSDPIAMIAPSHDAGAASYGDETIVALRYYDHIRLIPIAHGVAGTPADIAASDGNRIGAFRTGTEFVVWYNDGAGTNAMYVAGDGTVLTTAWGRGTA